MFKKSFECVAFLFFFKHLNVLDMDIFACSAKKEADGGLIKLAWLECKEKSSLCQLCLQLHLSQQCYRIDINPRGHGGEKSVSGLSGTMIHKQTMSLDSSNYVKYTAEIPTDSNKLSLPKHTNTHTAVNKLVCVRGKCVYAPASVDQEALTHTQPNIRVDKLSQCIFCSQRSQP